MINEDYFIAPVRLKNTAGILFGLHRTQYSTRPVLTPCLQRSVVKLMPFWAVPEKTLLSNHDTTLCTFIIRDGKSFYGSVSLLPKRYITGKLNIPHS